MNIQLQHMVALYDCFLASLASVTGRLYEEVWPKWFQEHIAKKEGVYNEDVDKAFTILGMEKDRNYWVVSLPNHISLTLVRQMLQGRRALLQVRSLTRANGWHIVVWTGQEIFDPQKHPRYKELDQCSPAVIWLFDELADINILETERVEGT